MRRSYPILFYARLVPVLVGVLVGCHSPSIYQGVRLPEVNHGEPLDSRALVISIDAERTVRVGDERPFPLSSLWERDSHGIPAVVRWLETIPSTAWCSSRMIPGNVFGPLHVSVDLALDGSYSLADILHVKNWLLFSLRKPEINPWLCNFRLVVSDWDHGIAALPLGVYLEGGVFLSGEWSSIDRLQNPSVIYIERFDTDYDVIWARGNQGKDLLRTAIRWTAGNGFPTMGHGAFGSFGFDMERYKKPLPARPAFKPRKGTITVRMPDEYGADFKTHRYVEKGRVLQVLESLLRALPNNEMDRVVMLNLDDDCESVDDWSVQDVATLAELMRKYKVRYWWIQPNT